MILSAMNLFLTISDHNTVIWPISIPEKMLLLLKHFKSLREDRSYGASSHLDP